MNVARSHRIARAVAVTVAATSALLSGALVASPAFAAEEHAFEAELQDPAPVAPGSAGVITYELTDLSKKAVEGVLINIALPRHVTLKTLDSNSHCQQTGKNPEGGQLISCNLPGKYDAGEKRVVDTPFEVAADAPAGTTLGKVGALAVPLKKGEPTKDWTDLEGPHVAVAEIKTAAGSAGPLDQLKALLGF